LKKVKIGGCGHSYLAALILPFLLERLAHVEILSTAVDVEYESALGGTVIYDGNLIDLLSRLALLVVLDCLMVCRARN